RSLEFRAIPIPKDARFVIVNTGVKHSLAAGEYNDRRADCEAGTAYFAQRLEGIKALRDVSLTQLDAAKRGISEQVFRRCRHVISENERTRSAARALEHMNLPEIGRLMLASHCSLRDDYNVSCHELDVLVELAWKQDGC